MPKIDFKFLRQLNKLDVLIPAGIVALALLFILVGRRQPPVMDIPPQAVVLGTAEAREISESSEYVAQLEADRIVDLKARVSGLLMSKNFAAGEMVKAGQVLFQIEPDQYQAALDTARAEVLSARAQFDRATLDFNRISGLYVKHTSPKSDFDSSKAAFEVAEAQLMSAQARETQAQLNLDYAAIKAPFDGRISDTPYSEGSLLGPESGVLATLVSSDPILATFGLSSRAIAASQANAPADHRNLENWRVRLRLTPESCYQRAGSLVYVSPTVDHLTDTVKFKARFANPEGLLRPGQTVAAILENTRPRSLVAVPQAAVLTDAEGRYVLMVKAVAAPQEGGPAGLVAERRPVVLARGEPEGEYFISEGLAAGEKFIVKGLMSGGAALAPGAPVRLAGPEAAADEGAPPPVRGEAGGEAGGEK